MSSGRGARARTALAWVLVAACHGTQPLPAPPTVQYKPRFEGALAASALDSAAADSPFSEVAEAREIPSLRTVRLPVDTRELRISDSYSMMAGQPVPMLRIVQTPATVKGELYFFWSERPGDARHFAPGRRINCTIAERGVRTCVTLGEFAQPVDWTTVAGELAVLGAWTIRDECSVSGSTVSDAGDLLIQRLTGQQFDKYSCNAPERRQDSEPGRRALAIYKYFRQLADRAS